MAGRPYGPPHLAGNKGTPLGTTGPTLTPALALALALALTLTLALALVLTLTLTLTLTRASEWGVATSVEARVSATSDDAALREATPSAPAAAALSGKC